MASTNDYPFVCPACGSRNLHVACEIVCKVIQEGDGEFETQPSGESDWYFDRHSFMSCQDCDLNGEVRDFETENTPVEN